MKLLDLFSGIGGFSLGLERAGFETIAFCEIEEFPRKVLAKHWPNVPIARDVKKLTYKDGVLYDDGKELYRGAIDVICGGFPCQDLSVAGLRKGIEAERSGLWSECARLLGEIRPKYAIFENVPNLLSGDRGCWFKRVLWDISSVGYDAEWHCISAAQIGAPHKRNRVWIVAHPNQNHWRIQSIKQQKCQDSSIFGNDGEKESVANANSKWKLQQERVNKVIGEWPSYGSWWPPEPNICRVANGIPSRLDRIATLGNSVVPAIPELIGKSILAAQP